MGMIRILFELDQEMFSFRVFRFLLWQLFKHQKAMPTRQLPGYGGFEPSFPLHSTRPKAENYGSVHINRRNCVSQLDNYKLYIVEP